VFGPVGFAYHLYLTHWHVLLLSWPIATMRFVQVTTQGLGSFAGVALEIGVEGLRVVQFLLGVAAAKAIAPQNLFRSGNWKRRSADRLTWRGVVLGFVGYGVVFGTLNLLIALAVGDAIGPTLFLKNIALIPVSVWAMLRIFRLIP
jgi:hypothetical protein